MKRFISGLSIALLLSTLAYSQQTDPTVSPEIVHEESTEIEEILPTTDAEDTMHWYSEETSRKHTESHGRNHRNGRIGIFREGNAEVLVPVVAITFTFIFPVAIIFIIYYFRYKNRKEQYRIAEQALTTGRPIPPGLFRTDINNNLRTKGINTICMGLGLFIFLWAITRDFGVGTVGLLLVFIGFGQLIGYYASVKEEKEASLHDPYREKKYPHDFPEKGSTNDTTSSTEE
ncbi:MAG: DUF6249 domain-containing protein [Bacteroides sp.]|nr:DUF6249 domain-containing protein [Bacteroides sp.]